MAEVGESEPFEEFASRADYSLEEARRFLRMIETYEDLKAEQAEEARVRHARRP